MSTNKKEVVIIGMGYGGVSTLQALSKSKEVKITIVDPREGFLLHKIGSLRTSTKQGGWEERALIPTTQLESKATIIKAKATSVDDVGQTVTLSNGSTLKYDVLVIATGSRNFSPAEPGMNVVTKEGTKKYWQEIHELYEQSSSILLVGSGPVALELSGELHDKYPQKKVTIVTKSKSLLNGKTPLRPSGIALVEKDVKKMGVEIIYDDEVTSEAFPSDLSTAFPLMKTPNGVTLKSGKKLNADLIVYCVGSQVTTGFLPDKWLDSRTKEVVVNVETLQVTGTQNVFAIGDAAKTEATKLAYLATSDGGVVAKNILQVLAKKQPSHKVQRMAAMLVPLGSKSGRVILPFTTLGNFWARNIKGKNLFTSMYWGQLGAKKDFPKVVA